MLFYLLLEKIKLISLLKSSTKNSIRFKLNELNNYKIKK
jgi:hypothetical protein